MENVYFQGLFGTKAKSVSLAAEAIVWALAKNKIDPFDAIQILRFTFKRYGISLWGDLIHPLYGGYDDTDIHISLSYDYNYQYRLQIHHESSDTGCFFSLGRDRAKWYIRHKNGHEQGETQTDWANKKYILF
jgi:hypothetical protein